MNMKKALFVLALLALGFGLKAECPTEVEDFTFTDCYGVEYNLFELLDGGQFVLIHVVTNTNTTSQTTTFINAFHRFGCNGHDLFFMEVLPTKNDSVCRSWVETRSIEFPVIGMDGGGNQFYSDYYDCFYYSSNNKYLMICSNHEIYQEPLGYHIVEELENYGFTPSNCEWGDHTAPTNLNASLVDGHFRLSWDGVEGASYYHVFYKRWSWTNYMMVTTADTCYQGHYVPFEDNHYYVVSCFEDGSEYISDTVSIGFEAPDFVAVDCYDNEIHLYDILDGGQYVFIDFFHYTCGPCRELMPYVEESYYYFGCNDKDVYYMEISGSDNVSMCLQWCEEFGVEYPTISKEGGGEVVRSDYRIPGDPFFMLIAPDRSIVLSSWYNFDISGFQSIVDAFLPFGIQVYQCYAEVEEDIKQSFGLFPNPADGYVTISVEGISEIRVFNAFGQLMDSFVFDNQRVRIETSRYPDGLYFVQVNGKGYGRFVVNH